MSACRDAPVIARSRTRAPREVRLVVVRSPPVLSAHPVVDLHGGPPGHTAWRGRLSGCRSAPVSVLAAAVACSVGDSRPLAPRSRRRWIGVQGPCEPVRTADMIIGSGRRHAFPPSTGCGARAAASAPHRTHLVMPAHRFCRVRRHPGVCAVAVPAGRPVPATGGRTRSPPITHLRSPGGLAADASAGPCRRQARRAGRSRRCDHRVGTRSRI
jgi:hypothetical protein